MSGFDKTREFLRGHKRHILTPASIDDNDFTISGNSIKDSRKIRARIRISCVGCHNPSVLKP